MLDEFLTGNNPVCRRNNSFGQGLTQVVIAHPRGAQGIHLRTGFGVDFFKKSMGFWKGDRSK
jgi:hypothetical protein